MKFITFLVILIPFLSVFVACIFIGISWMDLCLLLGMYFMTALGISIGFHRLFTHRAFETYTWVKYLFVILGSMAVQGPMLQWVAMHRRHHQHSDTCDDPHSPHHGGRGIIGLLKGFWHAHIGWLFQTDPPGLDRYVVDLKNLRTVSGLFFLWVGIGLIIPAILGGLITQSWLGFWSGLVWGGLVRIFLVHHITWSVNSACHLWGYQSYRSNDMSRNNLFFGTIAMGEGWHNNHHAFPTSARHGLRWWEIDVSYLVICMLKSIGLAWNLRLPAKEKTSALHE